jgi:hypothetical protein
MVALGLKPFLPPTFSKTVVWMHPLESSSTHSTRASHHPFVAAADLVLRIACYLEDD